MSKKNVLRSLFFISLVVSITHLFDCASEGPPSGGPKDIDPPSIVSTIPSPGATGVRTDITIVILFSEYLNRRSVAPSIFISPFMEEEAIIDVSRHRVKIEFNQPLEDSTTYIVTFGTGIADLRGNKLAESFQLAFSTGDSIDQSNMAGRVYRRDLPKGDVTVLGYPLGTHPVDTLIGRRPDYISNPDQEGYFRFRNMHPGEYLLVAIQDQNGNFQYDPGEWVGLPSKVSWLAQDSLLPPFPRMQVFPYPSDSLVMTTFEQLNTHQYRIEFNRPPKQQVTRKNFTFIGTDSIHPVAVSQGESDGEYFVESYGLSPDSNYVVVVEGLTDRFHLPFGQNRNLRDITITTDRDTLPFTAPEISIPDSTRNITFDSSLEIRFPRAVQYLPADSVLQLNQIGSRFGNVLWEDDRTLVATPDSVWPGESWITWTLLDSIIIDYRDSTYSDSMTTGSFQIASGTEYGTITGSIRAPAEWRTNLIRIVARRVEKKGKTAGEPLASGVNPGRSFRFRYVSAGNYRLEAFYDEDSTMEYSYGRPLPFVPSEKFVIFPDTVNVRARWETSGITIKFPETDK